MTQFEFLMTFASVVLAIGLTEIFSGWGRLVRSGSVVRWYPLWLAWSCFLVVLTIQYWSGIWPYREASFAQGYKVVWLALPTFSLIILGYLFSPDPLSDDHVDLKERYWIVAPRAFPLFALTFALAAAADYVVLGHAAATPETGSVIQAVQQAVMILLLLIAGYSTSPALHWAVFAVCMTFPAFFLLGMVDLFE